MQIVLENANKSFDMTEVVTTQKELLISEILSSVNAKYPFRVNKKLIIYLFVRYLL